MAYCIDMQKLSKDIDIISYSFKGGQPKSYILMKPPFVGKNSTKPYQGEGGSKTLIFTRTYLMDVLLIH